MDICRECQHYIERDRSHGYAYTNYCGHPSQFNQDCITGDIPYTPCVRIRVGPTCMMYQPKYTIRERIGDWIMNLVDKVWR